MSINFNDAPEQKEHGGGPIPKKSIVKVRLSIRQPSEAKQLDQHSLITKFSSGLLGLDCEFEVVAGTYEGVKVWENWFLRPEFQQINLTKGQEGICRGSDAKMRAIIEAARGVDPGDGSPAAVQARTVNDWGDFQNMEAPAKIGIDKPKPGDLYINNKIMRIITPDHEEYQVVMNGGEFISDIPIPEIPPGPSGQTTSGYQSPQNTGGYQPPGQGTQATNQQQTAPPNNAPGGAPGWAVQGQQK